MKVLLLRISWFIIAVLVVVLDYFTKSLAILYLAPYQSKLVCSVFSLTLAYNTGAAFSFLSKAGAWHRWFFAGFSLIMSCVLSFWLLQMREASRLQLTALSLILGGAIGNLYDRLMYGYVIDFLDFHYLDHHWPIFNLADTAICIGAFLLFIDLKYTK